MSCAGQTVLMTTQRQVKLNDVPGDSQALVLDYQRASGHPEFLESSKGRHGSRFGNKILDQIGNHL